MGIHDSCCPCSHQSQLSFSSSFPHPFPGVLDTVRDQLDLCGGNLRIIEPSQDHVPVPQMFILLLLLLLLVCCFPLFMIQVLSGRRCTASLDYNLHENRSLISHS